MPISQNNLKLLNDLEQTLRDQLLWIGRSGLELSNDAIDRLRNLRQFVMSLSVVIVAILFPLILIEKDKFENNDFFIVSLVLFCLVVLYGIIHLVIPTIREVVEIPKVSEYHGERIIKMIKEIQQIKKMDDNNIAGQKYEELKKNYSELPIETKPGWLERYWMRYESLIYFSFFIVGYVFLVVGLLVNF